jgi:hypothetical protein
MNLRHSLHAAMFVLALAAPALAQQPTQRPDPQALVAAQQAALAPLAWMDGHWRGEARHTGPDGVSHVVVQTERVGPMLDGAIKVIEGRGYNPDGSTGFNAFAVLGWDARRQALSMRSHAMGMSGDYAVRPTADGFVWEIPAGPMTIRYTATFRDGVWKEVGERIAEGAPPVRFFEMTLTRLGDSDWPAGGAVPMR